MVLWVVVRLLRVGYGEWPLAVWERPMDEGRGVTGRVVQGVVCGYGAAVDLGRAAWGWCVERPWKSGRAVVERMRFWVWGCEWSGYGADMGLCGEEEQTWVVGLWWSELIGEELREERTCGGGLC